MAAVLTNVAAHGQSVRGIRAADTRPIAPRGSVMMVQLTADQQGPGWPSELVLTLRDGRELYGVVGWIASSALPSERHWTTDLRGLAVHSSATVPTRDGVPAGVPYLFAHVPMDAQGELRLDRQTLRPVWVDVPGPAARDAPALELERTASPDRPDPDSAFEHWRWVLLAEERNLQAPPFASHEPAEVMLAEHLAAMWRVGLARLAEADAGLSADVRVLLTRTATDRGMPFAAWVADPGATSALLTELTRTGQSDRVLREYVESWMSEHDAPLVWPEADYDATLRLAVLRAGNVRRDEMTLRFPGVAQAPMRLNLEPNVLMRVLATKPILPSEPVPAAFGREPRDREIVRIDLPGRELDVPLRPRRYVATPPGVFLSELGAPLSLAEVQMLRRIGVSPEHATFVSVRKLRGRWEVFVDCRRPPRVDESGMAARPPALPDRLASFDALRGTEAITILIGPENADDGSTAILTVPETGWHRVYFGVQDGSLQVHTQTHADRWHARIVLPDDWLPHPELGPALFGFVRTHGGTNAIETGPNSTVPWRNEPGRVAIDLSEWDGAAGQ